jgi:hypothetical protein
MAEGIWGSVVGKVLRYKSEGSIPGVIGIFPVASDRSMWTVAYLFFSVGLPVANAPDVPQPCGLLYYP